MILNLALFAGGLGQDHVRCQPFFFDVMQNHSAAFFHGTRLLCAFNASWRVYSKKRLWTNCL